MPPLVVGTIEVDARLERPDGAYLHQETIRILVTFRNRGSAEQSIPYLVSHTLAFEIHGGEGGSTRRAERRFRPPGPLTNMPEPEAALAPNEDVTYRLPLDLALGLLPQGSHQVRLVVDGPPVPFATAWFPITVAAPRVAIPRSAPSSANQARELHTVWRDDGVSPPQMLLQVRTLRGRPLLVEGRRLGPADTLSEPAIAEAPAGVDPTSTWVAWVAGGRLVLARSRGEAVTIRDYQLPTGRFRVANPWVFSEKPDGSGTLIHGVLVDDQGHRLFGFSGDGTNLVVAPGAVASQGRLVSVASVPVDGERIAVVTARAEGTRTVIEGWTFTRGSSTSPIPLASVEGPIEGLAADYLGDGRTIWAASQRVGDGSRLRLSEGVYTVFGSEPMTKTPSIREITGAQGPWTSAAAYDEKHRLWVLRVDSAGARVFRPGTGQGIQVEVPAGFRHESLVFRRGELAQVLGLDPVAGFVAIPVSLSPNIARPDDEE